MIKQQPNLTLRDSLWLFLLPLGVLTAFAVGGYLFGPRDSEMLKELAQLLKSQDLSGPELALFILANNAVKAFLVLALGAGLGVLPVLFLAVNGVVLGQVTAQVVADHGPMLAIAGLAPHGVLELPAVLVAAGFGLRLGHEVGQRLLGRPDQVRLWWRTGLRAYLRVVLPLLVLAAIIEVTITPRLATLFM